MKASALQAARPRASYDIASEIADMLFLDDAQEEGRTGGGEGKASLSASPGLEKEERG